MVILIKTPFYIRQKFLDEFIDEKTSWMNTTFELFKKNSFFKTPQNLANGLEFAYLGAKHHILLNESKKPDTPFFTNQSLHFSVKNKSDDDVNLKSFFKMV